MMCRVLTINEREAHQFGDTPRAHAATNQRGMQSHALAVQCKQCKTAQLLNTLSKHMGSTKSSANFSNKTHTTLQAI
jgi:ribosomal protein L44E